MKKYSLILVFAVLTASCAKESIVNNVLDDSVEYVAKLFKVGIGETTKTSVADDGKVSWKAGDVVRYYSTANGTIGSAIVTESGRSAQLEMNVASNARFLVAAYGGESITANTSGNAFTLNGAVKAEQSGKFEDAHVAITKTYDVESESLQFKNITSLIKFSLMREDISYICFKANDNTALHGDGTLNVSFSGEDPSVTYGGNAGSSIKVTVGSSGVFFISTLPVELLTGFSIYCFDSYDRVIGRIITDGSLSLKSGTIINLGVLDSRISPVAESDLSSKGTANCYIVPAKGEYSFCSRVRGVSGEEISADGKYALVLWESFGTGTTPNEGDLINNVYCKDGRIYFTATGNNGNAVIAVTDRDEVVLWSWHIWCCMGYDAEYYSQEYNNSAGVMMDRNLGATSSTPGDVQSLGLLYQWGRKDPFLGSQSVSESNVSVSTGRWGYVDSNASTGTIEYSIASPTTFIGPDSQNSDWYYTGTKTPEGTRWSHIKTMYDPCPPGWRVPDGGMDTGIWYTALMENTSSTVSCSDVKNCGMNMGVDKRRYYGSSDTIWYPTAGYREKNNLSYVGGLGYYWSSTPSGNTSFYGIAINLSNYNPSNTSIYGAKGISVRCCKE